MKIDGVSHLLAAEANLPQRWQLQCRIQGKTANLSVEHVLRRLPTRRIAARVSLGDRQLFGKIYYHPAKARREWRRECRLAADLQKSGVPSPRLVATGNLSGGGLLALFEFISPATPFSEAWARVDEKDKPALFLQLIGLYQKLYRTGLCQTDIHLDNFVFDLDQRLMVIDPAGVRHINGRLTRYWKNNLALLLAQFRWQDSHALVRQALAVLESEKAFSNISQAQLAARVNRQARLRLERLGKKSLRESSLATLQNEDRFDCLINRDPRFERVADRCRIPEQIEKLMSTGRSLKAGNSATVVKVEIADREWVIKRYNVKNNWVAVKRRLGLSRAKRSWQMAFILQELGIRTPAPVALIAEKGWRGNAYLVTESATGEDIRDYCEKLPVPKSAFSHLFQALDFARISHGDLKGSNILCAHDAIALIDLDAMTQHRRPGTFLKCRRKDIDRLLRNWPPASPTHETLVKVLKDISPS